MRLGLISDIHSNLEALVATSEELSRLKVDRILCLGDVVGYGASPNECCAATRELAEITLLGNHDAAVSGRMDYSHYYEGARHALDWTAARLATEHRAWLAGLPYTEWAAAGLGLAHGSPVAPEAYGYVYALEQALELAPHAAALPDVTFVGHSHLPRVFAFTGGQAFDVSAPRVSLKKGVKYLVSVGSVGQPRDGDPRACFVVYDTGARKVTFHRVTYEVERASQKILDAGLAPNFGRRLHEGL